MSALAGSDDCISDLVFDEWFGGVIDASLTRRLERHVTQCARCALRCETVIGQRAAFLERVPNWDALASAIAAGGTHAGTTTRLVPPRTRGVLMGAVLALAASVALGFGLLRGESVGVRSKGGPRLGAYIKRGEQIMRAVSGDHVQPGDYVRVTYSSDVPVYFGLLNRDAHAAATYYPLAARTVRLAPGRDIALDFSIKLDDQLGDEQLHGVFCDEPRELEPLRAKLETSGRLDAGAHCRIDVLTLTKRAASP